MALDTHPTARSEQDRSPGPRPGRTGGPPGSVRPAWPTWARWASALLLAAATGAVLGTAMPRGPMTTGQSVAALGAAVLVGGVVGRLTGSRWSVPSGALALAGAFELARMGASGPSVDLPSLADIYGVLVLAVGRGFDGLVVLLPFTVAGLWGAAWARRARAAAGPVTPGPAARPRAARAGRAVRRAGLAAATALVLVLVVALVRPATTEAITVDGDPVEGSIAELVTIGVNGHDLSLMLRGADADAPVLLFLEGGPGGTAVGAMRYAGEPLEQHVVVATWDQRGTGRSADRLEPVATMTVDAMVADTIAVAEYLVDRFDEDSVVLAGSSWGTTLGVLAAKERPDLFSAYVGTGQMVDQQETDLIMYADSVARAERDGDEDLASRLRAIGPPPYEDTMLYPLALSANPDWQDYPRGDGYDSRSEYPLSLFVAELTLTEQVKAAAGLVDTFAALYPQLQDIDFREDVTRLDVPVHLVVGAHEAPGRAVLADEWFDLLRAPHKERVVLELAGHRSYADDPDAFAAVVADVVRDHT